MTLSRRDFIQSSGALVVCFSLQGCEKKTAESVAAKLALGNRIAINADGSVELFSGKVELGQGIGTALAQIAADELGVDFGRLKLRGVDTDYSPDESYTFSSISVQQSGPRVRAAAATGRRYMLQLAAEELGLEVATLSVRDGAIMAGDSMTGLDYWHLLGAETVSLEPDSEPKTIDSIVHNVIGSAVQRIDSPGKIFGKPSYVQDHRLPGMVHARVLRPPADRASVTSFRPADIAAMPGVLKVVRDGNFIAVIAEREGQARNAVRGLANQVEWSRPNDLPPSATIYDWLKSAESRLEVVAERGSLDLSSGERVIRATYQRPYQAHASISPSAAVALYQDSQLTVWSHAQGMYPLRAAIAHTLAIPSTNVRCVHLEASGCFGHNGADDAACDAAALAVHFPDRPVRVQWERTDEFLWEPLGPAMHIETQAILNDEGIITDWQHDLWSCPHAARPRGPESAGHLIYARHKANPLPMPPPLSIPQPSGGADRNAVPLYAIENVQVNKHLVTEVPLRGSSLRSLGAYGNIFAIESFIDELAELAELDPFDFRIRNLNDVRAIKVLERLRQEVEWDKRPPAGSGAGWGLGFAQFKNLSSYLAVVMQLSIDIDAGEIRLQKATAVCDAGLIINPDGVKAQLEGGIVQSASWTLKEHVKFASDERKTRDWDDYPILRFDEVPEVEVILINRPEQMSLGVGETAQGPTVAAIANAIFHASGKRLRQLPFTADRLG